MHSRLKPPLFEVIQSSQAKFHHAHQSNSRKCQDEERRLRQNLSTGITADVKIKKQIRKVSTLTSSLATVTTLVCPRSLQRVLNVIVTALAPNYKKTENLFSILPLQLRVTCVIYCFPIQIQFQSQFQLDGTDERGG